MVRTTRASRSGVPLTWSMTSLGLDVVEEAVDREVAPARVLLGRAEDVVAADQQVAALGLAAVAVLVLDLARVGAERGGLDDLRAEEDVGEPEAAADDAAVAEQAPDLVRASRWWRRRSPSACGRAAGRARSRRRGRRRDRSGASRWTTLAASGSISARVLSAFAGRGNTPDAAKSLICPRFRGGHARSSVDRRPSSRRDRRSTAGALAARACRRGAAPRRRAWPPGRLRGGVASFGDASVLGRRVAPATRRRGADGARARGARSRAAGARRRAAGELGGGAGAGAGGAPRGAAAGALPPGAGAAGGVVAAVAGGSGRGRGGRCGGRGRGAPPAGAARSFFHRRIARARRHTPAPASDERRPRTRRIARACRGRQSTTCVRRPAS